MKTCLILFCFFSLVLCEYRNFNASGNNLQDPTWGMPGFPFLRGVFEGRNYKEKLTYESDGRTPNTTGLLSAREISNYVVGLYGDDAPVDSRGISLTHMFWGQFLDHDITLTPTEGGELWNITIPDGDPVFSNYESMMPFTRSYAVNNSKYHDQINAITSFIDGSSIYGSSDLINSYLRQPGDCKLKVNSTKFGDLLIKDTHAVMENHGNSRGVKPITELFLAGDIRANENPVLASLHTVFVREHNRLCDQFQSSIADPEIRFQTARKWVIAFLQQITFIEYVTTTLGNPLPPWTAYNSSMDPRIDSVFSTATFRYGHTEITKNIPLYDPSSLQKIGDLPIIQNFFNPDYISNNGIEPLLSGMGRVLQNKIDPFYVNDLRNFLFGKNPSDPTPGVQYGTDLAARNTQRGRDHGIPRYNDLREYFGLPRKSNFTDITANVDLADALSKAYPSGVDSIDPYIGGLSEDPIYPSHIGELFTVSVREQYLRLRDGDRFYFENTDVSGFTDQEVLEIKNTKLAHIILRNTAIKKSQCSLFYIANSESDLDCGNNQKPDDLTGLLDDKDASVNFEEIGNDRVKFTITAKHDGWIGLGIPKSSSSGMLGSDVIIGYFASDGTPIIADYIIGTDRDYSCPLGVCIDTNSGINGVDNVIDGSLTRYNGSMTMTFTRLRNTGDVNGDNVFAPKGSSQSLLLACGPVSQNKFLYHDKYKTDFIISNLPPENLASQYTKSSPLPQINGTIYWTPKIDTVDFAVSVPIFGWVGLGFTGGLGKMIGSYAVIGWPGSTPSINTYYLGGKSATAVTPTQNLEISNATVHYIGNFTIIKFSVHRNETLISSTEPTQIIAASCNGCFQLQRHDAKQEPMYINVLYVYSWTLIEAHGIFMFLSFGLILPFGALYARYGGKEVGYTLWFKAHRIVQPLAVLVGWGGFILVIVQKGGNFEVGTHSMIGILVLSFSLFQVLVGVFRPHHSEDETGEKTFSRNVFEVVHSRGGYLLLLSGAINIFLGLQMVDSTYILSIIYACVLIVVFIISTILEIRKRSLKGYKKISDDKETKLFRRGTKTSLIPKQNS